jgi:CubicO group peptidase (beta-lactamase class C family)
MQPALVPAQLVGNTQPAWPANSDRPQGNPVSYGFGWFLDPYGSHSRMWHYGDTIGFHTYIVRFPVDRLTIIILCNRTDLDPEALALKAANLCLAFK